MSRLAFSVAPSGCRRRHSRSQRAISAATSASAARKTWGRRLPPTGCDVNTACQSVPTDSIVRRLLTVCKLAGHGWLITNAPSINYWPLSPLVVDQSIAAATIYRRPPSAATGRPTPQRCCLSRPDGWQRRIKPGLHPTQRTQESTQQTQVTLLT